MSRLRVQTECGDFSILLFQDEAPDTCQYFLDLVDSGVYEDSLVFRIVNEKNENRYTDHPIHIVQIGTGQRFQETKTPVKHESTSDTGLRHEQWTVSAARFEAGALYGSFFVCLEDAPELDAGGVRQPDQQGFAAFGRVCDGHEVVTKLYQKAEDEEELKLGLVVHNITREA